MSATRQDRTREQGGLLIITLVFTAMFVVIFSSISGLVSRSYHETILQASDEQAFQIAEGGLNYGGWRLAHNKEDLSSETRLVTDQQAGELGSYALTFTPATDGSTGILVTSKGYTKGHPERLVKLQARYGIDSIAKYALVTNSDVWFDTNESVGRLHSNGGIRMDGTSEGLITSAKLTYLCTWVFGCSNAGETKPGIWTSEPKSEPKDEEKNPLWKFPEPVVDYVGISRDLAKMKQTAIDTVDASKKNYYYGPSGAGSFGYHIVFNNDTSPHTYSIYKVTKKTDPIYSVAPGDESYTSLSHDISEESFLETREVPVNGVIYIEDTVWVEGHIKEHVTVGAGVFPELSTTYATIILNGNITYDGVRDGTRAFGAVAQKDIIIPYNSPDNLTVEGAFIAQKGNFMRRYYYTEPNVKRSKFVLYGMIGSNGIPTMRWANASGVFVGGYDITQSNYDTHLLYGAPPYFPTSGEYKFISWQQLP